MKAIEKVLAATPEVAAYSRRTGSELGLFATPQNTGDILVRLKPRAERERSAEEIISDLRPQLVKAAPAAEIEFVQLLQDMLGDLEGSPTPIEVKIFGDDPEVLEQTAEPVEEMLGKIDGVVDIVGMQRGNPEVTWTVDPAAAGRAGLSVEQVAQQLSAAWLGEASTDLRLLDRRVPVRVRLPDSVRFDPAKLSQTLLHTADGKLVPVSGVAHETRSNGQAQLLRENLRGMALVSGRLENRDLGSAVAEIRSRLAELRLPVGYTYEIGGQYRVPAPGVPRAALGLRGRGGAGVHGPGAAVPIVHSVAADPRRRAALARRRAPAAPRHRHGPECVVGDGSHPADWTRGEERHHADGLHLPAA